MRPLLERLRRNPHDPELWQVCADYLLERGLQLERPELFERWFSQAALYCSLNAVAKGVKGPPEELVDFHRGRPRLLRVAVDGAWPIAEITMEELAKALSDTFPWESETRAQLEPALARAEAALELPRPVWERSGVDILEFREVVEEVTDPRTQRALPEVREAYPQEDFVLGDEIGERRPLERQLLVLHVLLALRQSRPLRLLPPPAPEPAVEEALTRASRTLRCTRAELATRLDRGLGLYLGEGGELRRADPLEVPDEVLHVDRGPYTLAAARGHLERAIAATGARGLLFLLPLHDQLVLELVRKIRADLPLRFCPSPSITPMSSP
jgi:hypothetical protein